MSRLSGTGVAGVPDFRRLPLEFGAGEATDVSGTPVRTPVASRPRGSVFNPVYLFNPNLVNAYADADVTAPTPGGANAISNAVNVVGIPYGGSSELRVLKDDFQRFNVDLSADPVAKETVMRYPSRSCHTTVVALLGAGMLTSPLAAAAGAAFQPVRLTAGENIAFIVGGSGDPIPSQDYVDTNNTLYVQPNFPGYDPQALFTPEGNYALYTGVKSLTLDQSEAQGVQILDNAIRAQVDAGNHVAVLGDSQSSTISSMLMPLLASQGVSDVGFVLLADPNQPNGGLFERLDGVTIPSLGITFNGATPDDLYPTTVYMQAYDGFSDVPRYPINFLADLNSILGIQFVHPTYQGLTADQLASAVKLDTLGDTSTTYYGISLEHETVPYLPLLQPLLLLPSVGKPLADLLQPILTPLINLGYGDPDFGWDTGPANVATPFGLLPPTEMIVKALQESAAGVTTGIQAATHDLTSGATSALPDTVAAVQAATMPSFTDVVNTLTGAFSTAYAALLPTADVLTGVTVTIPTYDLQWLTEGLSSGNLLQAIGEPLANNTYLYTLAAGFEAFALISTVETISGDLSGLFAG